MHLDYTKVIILILWWRNFQLEYWRTFQLVSTMDEEELQHYALLQRIMELVKKELQAMDFVCGELSPADGMLTEWEYDVFGGFNGLSIGLKLVD